MDYVEQLEKSFNSTQAREWTENNKHYTFLISFVYVVLTYGGRYLMTNRKPMNLKYFLFAWNLFLAIFSILGAVRVYSEFVKSIEKSFTYSICEIDFYDSERTALWAFLFAFSKIIELGDTSFLVLRKRPIIFLHVYHHVTVMIYCAYSYADFLSSGRWYGAMNYFIHSIMYAYYAFAALKLFRIPRLINISITSLQILQMIAGLVITMVVIKFKFDEVPCHQSLSNAIMVWLMYFSYFVLFFQYFTKTYCSQSKQITKSKAS